jgi:GT2 family glycosyltransferase
VDSRAVWKISVRVSVCIAAMRPDTLGAAVRSVVNQTHRDWELVVVAQGPAVASISDTVHEALQRREGRVIAQTGHGLSRARNAAVAASCGDLIAMIDDDCEAEPDWLEALIAALRATPRAGLVGGALVPPPRSRRGPGHCPSCLPGDILYEPPHAWTDPPAGFSMVGGNFAFLRRTAETVGAFDETLGAGTRFAAAEEMDFQRRAANLGIAMRSTSDAVVHHTYGWRYGARTVWNFQRSYALGNGAHAAKMTLIGDPGGNEALRDVQRLAARDWFDRRHPAGLPGGLNRYYYFATGYRECLKGFVVDHHGVLQPNGVLRPKLSEPERLPWTKKLRGASGRRSR